MMVTLPPPLPSIAYMYGPLLVGARDSPLPVGRWVVGPHMLRHMCLLDD